MPSKSHQVFFLIVIAVFVAVIAVHNFDRYYIAKDYVLHVFADCDPQQHSCFIADPSTADPTFQSRPYMKVEINASEAPHCLDEHSCTHFTCSGITTQCAITYCSPGALESGETCSAPTQ